MPFEIFSRKVNYGGSPAVTFTRNGRFAFNKASTALFEKNAIENVLLLWDKERRLIGVRPITKKDTRAYKVRTGNKGNGCGFTASTFFKYVGVDVSDSRTMPARWDEQEEMFLIEVPEEYLKKEGVQLEGKKKPTKGA
jgi:hypothetical protein